MRVRLVPIILVCLLSSSTLFAQTNDTSTTTLAVAGPVANAASDELRQLTSQAQTGVRVERRRNDSVLNGALIGAAVGAGTGIALCMAMEPWEICNNARTVVPSAALGAGIGIAIDALIRSRETIVMPAGTHLSVAPVVGRASKGLRVAVRF